MSSSKNTYKKTTSAQVKSTYAVKNALINYFLVAMFTAFPLFFSDQFYSIRHDKYYLFLCLSALLVIAEIMLILTASEKDAKKPSASEKKIRYFEMSVTDWGMLSLLIAGVVSSLLSRYPIASLTGEQMIEIQGQGGMVASGRNNGLILIAAYVAVYFLVTRLFHFQGYVFVCFAVGSAIVCLLSVLNFFYIDPLGMYTDCTEKTIMDFTSTIGNKNLLSSFICMCLPFAIGMFIHSMLMWQRIVYLVSAALGFAALMTADSDSGILGIGVFTAVILVWCLRNVDRLKRFFLCYAVILLSARAVGIFASLAGDNTKGFDDFQKIFVYSNVGWILVAVFAVFAVALYLLDYKKPSIVISKAVPIAVASLFGIGVVVLLCVVYYFSVVDTETKLKGALRLLRFNDGWGTHRGIMWLRSFEIFGNSSFMEKMFGCGPDCFLFAFKPYFSQLYRYGDGYTNAAHNEYINYLITIGIAGLGAYLTAVGGVIARAVKYAKNNPIVFVMACPVICYSIQASVNIAQPITTPLFFIFIAVTEAFIRKERS